MGTEKILIVEDEFIVANNLKLVLQRAGYEVCDVAASVPEAREIIKRENVTLVLLDIHLKGELTGIDLAHELRRDDIAFVYLSANSNQRVLEAAKATEPYGFLVKPYREKDVLITLDIARYRHKHSKDSKTRQIKTLQNILAGIANEAITWEEQLLKMTAALQTCLPFDYANLLIQEDEHTDLQMSGFLRIGFSEYQYIGIHELAVISGMKQKETEAIVETASPERMAMIYNGTELSTACLRNELKKLLAETFNLGSELAFPLYANSGSVYALSLFSRQPNAYYPEHLALLIQVQQLILALLERKPAIANGDQGSKSNPGKSKKAANRFENIIGNSPALLQALDHIEQVAPLDTSVLILGESGTGKERIADCIHQLSPRSGRPIVKVNCAALPQNLIESELFGHEKGAFTGATDKKTGKFELANGGTIFLDEIGELPPEHQVKLLRVLQEKEIDRIGGRQPIKIDVRVIAATNRNLEKEVAEGRFRLDLYYRLNVFPVRLPSLRERKEDITQLALHFAARFFQKMNKTFHGINPQMLIELEAYNWPGNIRELENIIEQSVILNDGISALTLKRPLPVTGSPAGNANDNNRIQSLDDIRMQQQNSEKAYIISILKKTKGRIRGKGGAAELLNQKPTTLESRMAKLDIRKEDFYQ